MKPYHRRTQGEVEPVENRSVRVQRKDIQNPFLYSVLTKHIHREIKLGQWTSRHQLWGPGLSKETIQIYMLRGIQSQGHYAVDAS